MLTCTILNLMMPVHSFMHVLKAPIADHYTAPGGGKGNPYMISKLLHRASKTRVLVATTHLKAKISVANEDLYVTHAVSLVHVHVHVHLHCAPW